MTDINDRTPEDEQEPPEVVAHDMDEEEPAWCVLNTSCGSVAVQE